MRYPDHTVQEIIALNDIVAVISGYVQLNHRSSGNFFGLCPFHKEKSPSFCVNQSKQIYNCFGCNTGGSVISFIMKIENISFIDALKTLADRVNYKLPEKVESQSSKELRAMKDKSAELNKLAAQFYHNYLNSNTPDAINARKYLDERGVKPKFIRRFGLGLAPPSWDGLLSHLSTIAPQHIVAAGLASQSRSDATRYYDRFRSRLMFPIIDSRNRVVGFGGRIMGSPDKQEAKYVNTPETSLFHKSDNLYGLNLARKARKTELIVVEGYMDVLAMHQWGFTNTVGVLGTAFNESHTRLLKNAGCTSIVLMLDGDEAGVRATLRAIPPLIDGGIKVKTLNISEHDPQAKDPDEYLQRHGATPLATLIANAKSHVSFQLGLYTKKYNMETSDGRLDFLKEAVKLIATLSSAIETEAYVAEISQMSGFSTTAINADINKEKGISPTTLPSHRQRVSIPPQGRGIKDAKDTLINLVLTYHSAAKALEASGYITTIELGEGVHADLLQLAFSNAKEDRKMTVADVVSLFEDEEASQAATTIFINAEECSTEASLEQMLNDTAFKIKKAWAEAQVNTENASPETMKTLRLIRDNKPTISI